MTSILGKKKRKPGSGRPKLIRTHKPCSTCKQVKALDQFYKKKDGRDSRCKACESIRNKYVPRVKKVLGFPSLPEETQKGIKADLAFKRGEKGYMSVRAVAKKYEINYNTLLKWEIRPPTYRRRPKVKKPEQPEATETPPEVTEVKPEA